MRIARFSVFVLVAVTFVGLALPPTGAAQVFNKCVAGKNKCVSKKLKALLKCYEKAEKTGVNPTTDLKSLACIQKAMDKFDGGAIPTKGCFEKLEAKENPAKTETLCVTTKDTVNMEAKVDAFVADVVDVLEGASPFSLCGNGVKEGDESCDGADPGGGSCSSLGFASGALGCTAGCGFDTSGCTCGILCGACGNGTADGDEQCDGSDLGGASCTSLGFASGTLACEVGTCGFDISGCAAGFPPTGQTTCWDSVGDVVACPGTGHDGEVQAGGILTYTDHGDGTITDLNTGLMWEKKSDDGSIHDEDNSYTWDDTFAVHIAGLNVAVFAGHADWRVPNLKELVSILDLEKVSPAVSAAFTSGCVGGCAVTTCSCNGAAAYWTSTSFANHTDEAWAVFFNGGGTSTRAKIDARPVRAVRGGV